MVRPLSLADPVGAEFRRGTACAGDPGLAIAKARDRAAWLISEGQAEAIALLRAVEALDALDDRIEAERKVLLGGRRSDRRRERALTRRRPGRKRNRRRSAGVVCGHFDG